MDSYRANVDPNVLALMDIYRAHVELTRDATHGKENRLPDAILEKYDAILRALGVKGMSNG